MKLSHHLKGEYMTGKVWTPRMLVRNARSSLRGRSRCGRDRAEGLFSLTFWWTSRVQFRDRRGVSCSVKGHPPTPGMCWWFVWISSKCRSRLWINTGWVATAAGEILHPVSRFIFHPLFSPISSLFPLLKFCLDANLVYQPFALHISLQTMYTVFIKPPSIERPSNGQGPGCGLCLDVQEEDPTTSLSHNERFIKHKVSLRQTQQSLSPLAFNLLLLTRRQELRSHRNLLREDTPKK